MRQSNPKCVRMHSRQSIEEQKHKIFNQIKKIMAHDNVSFYLSISKIICTKDKIIVDFDKELWYYIFR